MRAHDLKLSRRRDLPLGPLIKHPYYTTHAQAYQDVNSQHECHIKCILSRFRGVTVNRVWTGYLIY
jgi:hypothetical protein